MSLFYTKNGVYLGVAFRDLSGPLYPTVGMRTQGEIVEANFGQRKFIFSIDDYVKEEKKQAWQTLEGALHKAEAENQSLPSQTMNQLVLSYMIHHGYAESAKQFSSDMALQSTNLQGLSGKRPISSAMESSSYPPAVVGAERRKAIKEAILTGEIDRAMELLESDHPGIMGSNEDMTLQLHCRKFVEMVNSASASLQLLDHSRERGKDDLKTGSSKDIELVLSDSGRMDIDQDESSGLEDLGTIKNAIEYGQFLQKHYEDNTRHSVQEMLHETFAVLATHHVPGHHHKVASISREKVAETVNTAILAYQNRPTTAPLETLCQQTNVAVSELTRLGVGEAAFFDCSE
ncbi:hypothetical protein BGX31_007546 [Mortierella sp. GBA43]|nr:hypothetical protein BGX31_007546 [Mortierella sp. GBA43]